MRVAVTGSGGLVGSALVPALRTAGHDVVRLVRRPPSGPSEVRWDPIAGELDEAGLDGVTGVVHLAGEGIGERRWSEAQKDKIRQSRVRGTSLLASAMARLAPAPSVMVSASAVGIYGDRADEELTEESGLGTGFLADVCREWEEATAVAEEAGTRVVHLRSGVVLSRRGGALRRQLPLFRLGLGGRLGSGRQWVSWIAVEDEVGAILHALGSPDLTGPVNSTAPNPVTNAEFTRSLARALRRPAVLPVPRAALALVLGRGLVNELVMASQRVLPTRLQKSGYSFRHTHVDDALRAVTAKDA